MRALRVQALRSRRETRVTRARCAFVASCETERLKAVRGARTVLAAPRQHFVPTGEAYAMSRPRPAGRGVVAPFVLNVNLTAGSSGG